MARRLAPTDSRRVCVAQVGGAHGIRGEVRLKAFTSDPMALGSYGPLQTEDGARWLDLAALRPAKDMLIARFNGVEDRNAAEALRNLRLYIPRDRLAKAEEGEFYHADLIGLAVVNADGRALGRVTAVQNFGAGDLLEVAAESGAPSILIPFTRTHVPTVDLVAGQIVVDWAEA